MNTLEKSAELIGRILMSAIFLLSGLSKIGQYAGTQAYMPRKVYQVLCCLW